MKKKILGTVFALALSQCLLACGSSADSYVAEEGLDECAPMENMAEDFDSGDMYTQSEEAPAKSPEENQIEDNRKLIRTVYLSVETKEYDELLVNFEGQISEMGGYVENMSAYNRSMDDSYGGGRSASYTVRIPADRLDEFLTRVGETVNVVEQTESVDDVTLRYVDMDSHVRMLKEEQERLFEFLEQAETMEDIIAIEQRLSEVKYQIESMNSQLRTFDNQVDYATVNIDIREVVELTPVTKQTPGERIVSGFAESFVHVKEAVVEFFVWMIVHIPYLLIWAPIAIIVFLIVWFDRKRAKRRSQKMEELVKMKDLPNDGGNQTENEK